MSPYQYDVRSFPITWRNLGLPAYPRGVGYEFKKDVIYNWHGGRRSLQEFIIFQYTVSGCGRMSYKKQEHDLNPGQAMLIMNPGPFQYQLPRTSTHWEFVFLSMGGVAVQQLYNKIIQESGPILNLKGQDELFADYTTLFDMSLDSEGQNPYDASALVYQLCLKLFKAIKPDRIKTDVPVAVEQVIQLCRNELGNDKLNVDDMAATAGLSRYYFSRFFKLHTGLAPGEYLLDLRLSKAAQLLATSSYLVKEIAAACGFGDVNYFCRVFRKRFGCSPGAVRKTGLY